jgi:hypothetical protein
MAGLGEEPDRRIPLVERRLDFADGRMETASVAFASLKSRMAVLPAPRQVGFRA